MKHYVVVICGSRDAQSIELLPYYTKTLHFLFGDLLKMYHTGWPLVVIQGGQRGVDRLAGNLAIKHGCGHVEVTALWDVYHKSAGPIRNAWMLALQPAAVYGVHHDLEHSRGTLNCLNQAEALGIKAYRVPVDIPRTAASASVAVQSSSPSIKTATRRRKS